MIPFPHSRFPSYYGLSSQYDDVPEVCCEQCDTMFEQLEPDATVCPDCMRRCKCCGEKYAQQWEEHCCPRCQELPDEEPTPQPNQNQICQPDTQQH